MPKTPGLRWKIYFFFFMPFAISGLVNILSSESNAYKDYHILMVFDQTYVFSYYLNVLSAFLTFISLMPLFLYSFHKRFLVPKIWQWMLALRIIFECTGHAYEVKFFKSIFYAEVWLGIASIATVILIMLPSYVACFRYAFRQDRLFGEN